MDEWSHIQEPIEEEIEVDEETLVDDPNIEELD
jgi:hypothetical protein